MLRRQDGNKSLLFDTLSSIREKGAIHSTVTDLAKFRGQSTCRQTEVLSYYITILNKETRQCLFSINIFGLRCVHN